MTNEVSGTVYVNHSQIMSIREHTRQKPYATLF